MLGDLGRGGGDTGDMAAGWHDTGGEEDEEQEDEEEKRRRDLEEEVTGRRDGRFVFRGPRRKRQSRSIQEVVMEVLEEQRKRSGSDGNICKVGEFLTLR